MHVDGWLVGCGRQVGRSVGRLLDGWLIGLLFLGSLASLCGALFIICLRKSSANLSQPRSLPYEALWLLPHALLADPLMS